MFPTYSDTIAGLSSDIEGLERERLTIVKNIKWHGAVFFFSLLIVIIGMILVDSLIIIGSIGLLIYLIVVIILISRKHKKFRENFKHIVVWGLASEMVRLCKMPNETDKYRYDCKYSPRDRIDNDTMTASRLFEYSIDKIRGEDLFYGMLGLTEFKFSELTVIQTQTSTDSKGHTTRTDVTMFDGILFTADFHKEFSGVTLLRSATIFNTGTVGRFLQPLRNMLTTFSREKKRGINLENEDFNRAFDVQTTDDITARYILSSTMMERLLRFKSNHSGKVEISFVHSSMYVALSSGKNYFEPKLYQPLTSKQTEIIYDDLSFFFSMIEEFDLNTRIWSKA